MTNTSKEANGTLNTHGTPVAVANDVTVRLAEGTEWNAEQATMLDGGWCVLRGSGTVDVVPREQIEATRSTSPTGRSPAADVGGSRSSRVTPSKSSSGGTNPVGVAGFDSPPGLAEQVTT